MKHLLTTLAVALTLPLAATAALAQQERQNDLRLEDLPQPVREAVQREVGDGTIEDIDRDTERGQTVYEVEFDRDGREYEIEVSPDGTVVDRRED